MLELKIYKNEMYDDLSLLVAKLGIELYGREPDVDLFIGYHNDCIYMVYDKKEPVGFCSYYFTDNCGFSDVSLFCDFMYIEPEHRSSNAFSIMLKHMLDIATEHNYLFGLSAFSDTVKDLSLKYNAKFVYNIVEFSKDSVLSMSRKLNKIKTKDYYGIFKTKD